MRHSLKFKLSFIIMGLVAGLIILISILNVVFFERFYIFNREKLLLESFNKIIGTINDNDDEAELSAEIYKIMMNIKDSGSINVLIADSNLKTLYSTQSNYDSTIKWFREFTFNPDIDRYILKEGDNYYIQRGMNKFEEKEYIELVGSSYDSRYNIILQVPIESIKENVEINNTFFIFVGLFATLFGGALAYVLAGKFTKPIKNLSATAEAMADMKFGTKATVSSNDEIGILAASINTMSDNLEKYISDLKKSNLELQKDIEKKEELDSMRRDFISNVSHELKTPIALIQGYAEGLKDGVTDDPDSMEYYCEVIVDEASKMNKMVRQLLTLNQLESGTDSLSIDHFDIVKHIAEVAKTNQIRVEQKGATLVFNQCEPIYVWADQFKIEEVITNFLSNAVNHVEKINQEEPRIEISFVRTENIVRIKVYNTGRNIPDKDIDHIWDKFYKVDKARTREYGGSGIGLSIVKAIMDSHGQACGAANCENGVEFWFELDCGNR